MNKFLLPLILGLLCSCHSEDRDRLVQLLIQEKMDERLQQYTRVSLRDCQQDLMEDAIGMVDSMLRLNPIQIRLDSLERPPRPDKPVKPAFIKPTETEALEPLQSRKSKPNPDQELR